MFWLKQSAIALDQFLNAFIAVGWADETFSARCWREGKTSAGWNALRVIVDLIFFLDKQHCFSSYLSEAERKQLPDEYQVKGF